jgi:hypothetical protein
VADVTIHCASLTVLARATIAIPAGRSEAVEDGLSVRIGSDVDGNEVAAAEAAKVIDVAAGKFELDEEAAGRSDGLPLDDSVFAGATLVDAPESEAGKIVGAADLASVFVSDTVGAAFATVEAATAEDWSGIVPLVIGSNEEGAAVEVAAAEDWTGIIPLINESNEDGAAVEAAAADDSTGIIPLAIESSKDSAAVEVAAAEDEGPLTIEGNEEGAAVEDEEPLALEGNNEAAAVNAASVEVSSGPGLITSLVCCRFRGKLYAGMLVIDVEEDVIVISSLPISKGKAEVCEHKRIKTVKSSNMVLILEDDMGRFRKQMKVNNI